MKPNKTVLLLEDDSDIISIIRYILEGAGFKVRVADAKKYREDIDACPPGLVLLDYRLNGILGSKICEELKADPKTSFIPVILTSATNNIAEIANQCKPDDVLPKPFDIDDLVSKVSRFLNPKAEIEL